LGLGEPAAAAVRSEDVVRHAPRTCPTPWPASRAYPRLNGNAVLCDGWVVSEKVGLNFRDI